MEIVTVKFKEKVLKKIDKSIAEHNFNSRTEFIREAVRDKLEDLSRDELAREFSRRFYGKSGKKTTDKEHERIREMLGKELLADLNKKF
ncbi:ribbon-helix-helix domain-containing protein [Candidatus Woesearchaeota archaeon]|nr:ribbon-helix-helix domain-containing protein [Candidatus Woesearchaeota archaeon]